MAKFNNSPSYGGYTNNMNKNRNNGNNNSHSNHNNNFVGYVGAPYNFIPINNKVIGKTKENMEIHDVVDNELMSGEISYGIIAKTPIFINDGNSKFFKNEYGKFAIPGSSMRGLVRSNAQILGFASLDQDIDDYSLMFREVANGKDKNIYGNILGATTKVIDGNSISVLTKVKAGYISNVGGKYYIHKNVLDKIIEADDQMNYYVVNERYIAKHEEAFPFFWENADQCQYNLRAGFKKVETTKLIKDKEVKFIKYEGTSNSGYKVGSTEVCYKTNNNNQITSVVASGNKAGYFKGMLVNSGFMNYKKVHYIIPEIDKTAESIQIPSKDIEAFSIDLESRTNSLKRYKNMAYFSLPQNGETKPVFYIRDNGHLYFGFTPRLRVFYNHTIKHGLKQNKANFDYVKSLFGCINETDSYKSKVSFTDAVVTNNVKTVEEKKVILGGPSPKSYFDYIVQENGNPKSYNDADFNLRGVKQYWLHKKVLSSSTGNGNVNVMSRINALAENTEFRGKIRFNNLTKDELGLLIWSIKLNDDSLQNIGMAKPYGYGCFKVTNIELNIIDNEKAYSTAFSEWKSNPYVKKEVGEFINIYKQTASKALNTNNINELPRIKNFFDMKSEFPDEAKIRYMQLNEYQARKSKKIALQTVDQVLKKNGK